VFADAVNKVSRVVSSEIVVSVLEPVKGVRMINFVLYQYLFNWWEGRCYENTGSANLQAQLSFLTQGLAAPKITLEVFVTGVLGKMAGCQHILTGLLKWLISAVIRIVFIYQINASFISKFQGTTVYATHLITFQWLQQWCTVMFPNSIHFISIYLFFIELQYHHSSRQPAISKTILGKL